ncbi:MAG: mandelate racemase/muconate lactonizing enzyme family protein [Planctomycetota bacterium]
MKITKIDTCVVGVPWKNWLFVEVHTDDGLTGIGEATVNAFARTVEAAIRELESLIIGKDPFQPRRITEAMRRDLYTDGGQIQGCAAAAIETACFDIMGKALNTPLYNLIGGKYRDRIRTYANGWYRGERTPDNFVKCARKAVALGYTALKFDPFGDAYRVISRYEEDFSIDIVAAVRDAVGPNVELLIEGHSRFTVATAITIGHRLQPFHIGWFEEPVPHHRIASVVEVSRLVPVPVATGESFYSTAQFAELLRHDAVHILQPEPMSLGGIQPIVDVAAMAEANNCMISPHCAQGPIGSYVSMHVAAACPNCFLKEHFDDFEVDWVKNLLIGDMTHRDGHLYVSDAPGLGASLNHDVANAHLSKDNRFIALFKPGWETRDQYAD